MIDFSQFLLCSLDHFNEALEISDTDAYAIAPYIIIIHLFFIFIGMEIGIYLSTEGLDIIIIYIDYFMDIICNAGLEITGHLTILL